jgi:coenzyme F420-reducing hydrogenase alpha subunit
MARGLLIHQVQLDSTQAEARVASCQVLAPTEWNFHPQGAVAQVLEAMPTHTTQRVYREADLLISAYDPCVRHEFVNNLPTAQPQGELHA